MNDATARKFPRFYSNPEKHTGRRPMAETNVNRYRNDSGKELDSGFTNNPDVVGIQTFDPNTPTNTGNGSFMENYVRQNYKRLRQVLFLSVGHVYIMVWRASL